MNLRWLVRATAQRNQKETGANPAHSTSILFSLCHRHLPNVDTSSLNSFPADHLASSAYPSKFLSFSCLEVCDGFHHFQANTSFTTHEILDT